MPRPALQVFHHWNARAANLRCAAIATELLRERALGPEAYADELNQEAEQQHVGAAAWEPRDAAGADCYK